MPVVRSGSDSAFKSNLKAEINSGKPQKQALAIAYSYKRKYGGKDKKGGSMFQAKKSLFKPKGGSMDNNKPTVSHDSSEDGHGGVGPEHPHHQGGEGYHHLEHEGRHHDISHHEDGIHHSVTYKDGANTHLIHKHGENSQIVNPESSQDSLATPMPRIN